MSPKEIGELPKFFDRYINLNDQNADLIECLNENSPEFILPDIKKLKDLGGKVYAPEKWTIKDILQHCIDTERIMAFRALCFARMDSNLLPGFDENEYAINTIAEKRSVDDLIEEFILVRKSNILMFKNFNDIMLLNKGQANNTSISPLALGFVIAGHLKHHIKIINERYLPLLG